MRKGFFLSESEKNRISNLYGNKIIITEQYENTQTPTGKKIPTGTTEINQFIDYMDQTNDPWVYKTVAGGPISNSKRSPIVKRNGIRSWSVRNAWKKHGDAYLSQQQTQQTQQTPQAPSAAQAPPQNIDSNWFYFSGGKVLSGTNINIQELINKGELKSTDQVYHVTHTNSSWLPISQVPGHFNIVPSAPTSSSTPPPPGQPGQAPPPGQTGAEQPKQDEKEPYSGVDYILNRKKKDQIKPAPAPAIILGVDDTKGQTDDTTNSEQDNKPMIPNFKPGENKGKVPLPSGE